MGTPAALYFTAMTAPQTLRSNRRMIIAIGAMVVLWGLVMLQRREIRARWWEHKLVHSETLEDRARYLALLAGETSALYKDLLGHASMIVRVLERLLSVGAVTN